MIKPLLQGDWVSCVAASSTIENDHLLNKGLAIMQSWGLRCRHHQLNKRSWGYLAGNDQQRLADLNIPEASLLACVRGGWGAARLLENAIIWKPGWLLGFSDVTALLWSRLAAGFAGGIHGPLLTTLSEEPEWSQQRLRRLLFGKPLEDLQGEGSGLGKSATGQLVVANLTVASHLLGSNHVPNLNGAILILEDIGEAPYRIDRMLTHWRLCGALTKLAGIGFGNFKNCEVNDEELLELQGFTTREVLEERSADLGIPRVFNLPVGHRSGNAALPMGEIACIDERSGRLKIIS